MPFTSTELPTDILTVAERVDWVYLNVDSRGLLERPDVRQVVSYVYYPDPLNISVRDAVSVAQAIDPGPVRPASGPVEVSQSIVVAFVRAKAVADAPAIVEFVVATVVPASGPPDYYIDQITSGYAGTLTTPTALTMSFTDALMHTTAVTLRKPDFGDADSYESTRIQRNNRGGDLQIFRDPMWPTTEILDFKFSFLDDPAPLLAFLTASQGGLVDLHDQYGRHWQGYILTPEGQVVQPKRTTSTAAFRFQGVLQ